MWLSTYCEEAYVMAGSDTGAPSTGLEWCIGVSLARFAASFAFFFLIRRCFMFCSEERAWLTMCCGSLLLLRS